MNPINKIPRSNFFCKCDWKCFWYIIGAAEIASENCTFAPPCPFLPFLHFSINSLLIWCKQFMRQGVLMLYRHQAFSRTFDSYTSHRSYGKGVAVSGQPHIHQAPFGDSATPAQKKSKQKLENSWYQQHNANRIPQVILPQHVTFLEDCWRWFHPHHFR